MVAQHLDHRQLLGMLGDPELVARHHRHHGEQRALGLPALGAAAGVIVRDIALDGDGDRFLGAAAGERAALELLVAGLEALVERWMQFDRHGNPLAFGGRLFC